MATNSMIPYSNPAGNNQTTPGAGTMAQAVPLPVTSPMNPTAAPAANPLIPNVIPGVSSTVPSAGSTAANQTNTQQQLTDIYGQGVGTDLTDLLGSIGGTNSTTLQEFEQSLVPQEATAKANLDASLGAAGVGGNSSVAAIGNANLQAQEFAATSNETAQLTQEGQQLESNILGQTEGAAEKEVASSGWDVFGQVIGDVGSLAGDVLGMGGITGAMGKFSSFGGGSVPTVPNSMFSSMN